MSEKRQNKNVAANDMSSAATMERITGVEPAYAAWEAITITCDTGIARLFDLHLTCTNTINSPNYPPLLELIHKG